MASGPSYYYPSSTGQTKAGPWKAQAPYLKGQFDFGDATMFGTPEEAGIFKRAQDIANTPLDYYGMSKILPAMPIGYGNPDVKPTAENLYTSGLSYDLALKKYYAGDYYVMPGGWHETTNYLTDPDTGDYKVYGEGDTIPEGKSIGDIKTESKFKYVDRPYVTAPRFSEKAPVERLSQAPAVSLLGGNYRSPFADQQASVATLAAFTPEQFQAQELLYNRAIGHNPNLPLSEPQGAISDIITGTKGIDKYSAGTPSIGNTGQLSSPYITDYSMNPSVVNSWGTPQAASLDFQNWDELEKLIRGDFLSPTSNPYLANMVEYAQRPVKENYLQNVIPALQSTFEESGNYGTGAWYDKEAQANADFERALGDISTQMYGNAYESERQRMMSGLGLSGELATTEGQMKQQASILGAEQAQERTAQNAMLSQEAGRLNLQTDTERALQEALLRQQTGEFNIGFDQKKAIELANMQNTINMFNAQMGTETDKQNIENILQSSMYAPELLEADYADMAKLAALGEEYQAYNQKLIEEDIARQEWANMLPWELAGMESQLIGGNWGSRMVSNATQEIAPVSGGK